MGIKSKADEIKNKAGRFLQHADRLDGRLQDYLDGVLDGNARIEPIDVRKQVLRRIDEKIVTIRPGERGFPFKSIRIEFFAADHEQQAVLEDAFVEADRLKSDIEGYIRQQTGAPSVSLRVRVTVQVGPPPADALHNFRIEFQRHEAGAASAGQARLVVLKGTATKKRYPLNKDRVYIGRLPQATDQSGRIIRRNDIVFDDDGDKINQSVSRIHATIRCDLRNGEYRLCDDLSAYGTRIVREGQPYDAPQRRGLKLQNGDEIFFGDACVRFERIAEET